jgi:hypothetical protein
MKKTFLLVAGLVALWCVMADAKTITLTVNNSPFYGSVISSNQVTIGTNEVAELEGVMTAYPLNASLEVTKDGVTVYQRLDAFVANPRLTVAGPAKITLHGYDNGSGSGNAFVTFKVCPESFPPGLTLILPTGTVGIVHVESSTNLVQWQEEWVSTFSNTNDNRFFRIRADRLLP